MTDSVEFQKLTLWDSIPMPPTVPPNHQVGVWYAGLKSFKIMYRDGTVHNLDSSNAAFIFSLTGEATVSDSARLVQGSGILITQSGHAYTIAATASSFLFNLTGQSTVSDSARLVNGTNVNITQSGHAYTVNSTKSIGDSTGSGAYFQSGIFGDGSDSIYVFDGTSATISGKVTKVRSGYYTIDRDCNWRKITEIGRASCRERV